MFARIADPTINPKRLKRCWKPAAPLVRMDHPFAHRLSITTPLVPDTAPTDGRTGYCPANRYSSGFNPRVTRTTVSLETFAGSAGLSTVRTEARLNSELM